ncbi:MAG: prolyl oligopeptidase family serine peptidase [Candidatus Eisenbacteria sp.]|nr:prolyl oligopeptidase family serine peptidase [Candidatus Eisenbacteria bacterium]
MKKALWILMSAGVAAVLLVVVSLYRDYTAWFDHDSAQPLDSRVRILEEAETYRKYEVRLRSLAGADIVSLLSIPSTVEPHPLIMLQGGYHRGKDALNLIGDDALRLGYAVFSMDYRYTGSVDNPVLLYLQTRGAMRDAVIDLRRVLDYFQTREDIDQDRLVMVGVSLGALFGPILMAVDDRLDYLVLIYGGGNLAEVVRANSPVNPVLTEIMAGISSVFYAPFEPLRYAGRISPRPLLMIHGTGDNWVPARCAREFYDKVGDPKEIIWHDRGHIRSYDTEEIERLGDECLAWLVRQFSK